MAPALQSYAARGVQQMFAIMGCLSKPVAESEAYFAI
jgi:hypothetical protein